MDDGEQQAELYSFIHSTNWYWELNITDAEDVTSAAFGQIKDGQFVTSALPCFLGEDWPGFVSRLGPWVGSGGDHRACLTWVGPRPGLCCETTCR